MPSLEKSSPRRLEVKGLNVQWPWSRLIVDGKKTIETRSYPLPASLRGRWVAIIETPGPQGKKNGIHRAQVIGLVKFKDSKLYSTKKGWLADYDHHLVSPNDPLYAFNRSRPKYGWLVEDVMTLSPQSPPPSRGIVYSSEFTVSLG